MIENKIKHLIAVGRKMSNLALNKGLSTDFQNEAFLVGLLHEIGYEYTIDPDLNIIVGTDVLKRVNFKYLTEIKALYDDSIKCDSVMFELLTAADLSISEDGEEIDLYTKLMEVKKEYGFLSKKYRRLYKLVEKAGALK